MNSETELMPSERRTEDRQTLASSDRRVLVGVFLVTVGGIVQILSYLMGIVPMLAFGLGSFLIGIMILFLPESGSIADSVATNSVLPSLLNIEYLLEDLDLDEKGIYIPVSGLGVSPKVFVPLTSTTKTPSLELTPSRKIFVTVGKNPEDIGVLLDAPGSGILTLLERSLHTDLAKVQLKDLRTSINSGFKALGIAKVISLEHEGDIVRIEMEFRGLTDLETKLRELAPRLSALVGTPIVSAVAASVSKTTGKYVRVKVEALDLPNGKISMTLQLRDQAGDIAK